MNPILHPDGAADVPWPTSYHRMPDTTMPPDSENVATAAADMLKQAVQGAHDTIDHFADSAAPAVQLLGDSVAAAGEALHADAWAESVRTTVRDNPLACVAAALALGVVIARLAR